MKGNTGTQVTPQEIQEAEARGYAAGVSDVLGDQIVSYHPALSRALGNDPVAALFLEQLLHWTKYTKDPDGWVFRSQEELEEEIGISADAQRSARRRLAEIGLIEEKRMWGNRLHYRVRKANLKLVVQKWRTSTSRPSDSPRLDLEVPENSDISIGDNHRISNSFSPEKKKKGKVKKSPEEYQAMAEAWLSHKQLGHLVEELVDQAAAKNRSGNIAWSRVWNQFVSPVRDAITKGVPIEALEHGLSEAVRREKNVAYALAVARDHREEPVQPSLTGGRNSSNGSRNGSRGRTYDVTEEEFFDG